MVEGRRVEGRRGGRVERSDGGTEEKREEREE